MIVLAISNQALAAPVGGSNPVIDGSLAAFSFEYDYVSDRDLESNDISAGEISDQSTVYGRLSFKPLENIALYVKAGATDFNVATTLSNGTSYNEKYQFGFYTGGGASLTYEFVPRVRATIDNQINWYRCDIEGVEYGGANNYTIDGDISGLEYQLSGIISYLINYQELVHPVHGEWPQFMPYIGVKYSYLRLDSDVTATNGSTTVPVPSEYENEKNVGIILGTDIGLPSLSGFSFNLEFRLLDETAVSTYLNYNF